jgi:hypothetical protein
MRKVGPAALVVGNVLVYARDAVRTLADNERLVLSCRSSVD